MGKCWLLILLELIAGSGGVVFAMFSYSTHCSVSFYFKVQGAMEKNCIRRPELKCFVFLGVIFQELVIDFLTIDSSLVVGSSIL